MSMPAMQQQGQPSLFSRHFHTKERDEIATHGDDEMLEGGGPKIVFAQPTSLSLSLSVSEPYKKIVRAFFKLVTCASVAITKGALFLLRLRPRPVAPDACDLGGVSAHGNVVHPWSVLQCPSSTLTDTGMESISFT